MGVQEGEREGERVLLARGPLVCCGCVSTVPADTRVCRGGGSAVAVPSTAPGMPVLLALALLLLLLLLLQTIHP